MVKFYKLSGVQNSVNGSPVFDQTPILDRPFEDYVKSIKNGDSFNFTIGDIRGVKFDPLLDKDYYKRNPLEWQFYFDKLKPYLLVADLDGMGIEKLENNFLKNFLNLYALNLANNNLCYLPYDGYEKIRYINYTGNPNLYVPYSVDVIQRQYPDFDVIGAWALLD